MGGRGAGRRSRGGMATSQAQEQGAGAGESALPTMGVNRESELEVDDVLNSELRKPVPSTSSNKAQPPNGSDIPQITPPTGEQSFKHIDLWAGVSHSNHGGMELRLAFCRVGFC